MKKFQSNTIMTHKKYSPTISVIIMLIMQFQRAESVQPAIALPGCQDTCGDVQIPYPFGIGRNCSLEGFALDCNTIYNPPTPILYGVAVRNIYLSLGQARVNNTIATQCYNPKYNNVSIIPNYWNLSGTPFRFNNEKNKFTVIGCDTLAYIQYGNETDLNWGGCVLNCYRPGSIINGSCSGIGCCQSTIPKQTNYYYIVFDTNFNNSEVYNFSRCGYGILMEYDGFVFSSDYITTDKLDNQQVPLILDWAIGNETCEIVQVNRSSYACISKNSVCVDSSNGPGYICNCATGYEGNPYIAGGCPDINECANNNMCSKKCHNLPGTYRCSCPPIMRLKKNTVGDCEVYVPFVIGITIMLGFGTACSIILLYFAIAKRIKLFEKREHEKLKRKYFVQNNGLLLQQLIANSHEDASQKMRNFRLHELEKATNRFDNSLILGRGGHGEVYKGILSDQRVVAIKRSKIVDQTEINQFINEVVILSQVNHRNVVKLYGCCLETEVPLLVYEFISNGTLFSHLHVAEHCSLTWKHRLRIALEVARAISYLHSSASISIFHRDIKSSNILLDDYFTAKLSDFGASRSVQIDQTGVTTAIQGTHGYLDPEYYCTGRLTPKSDVYSFGVILIELLTREKPLFSSRKFEGGSLIAYFSFAMKENQLIEILDPQVVSEGHRTELEAVAKLVEMCLRMKGEERPTMKEVELRLDVFWRSNQQQKSSLEVSKFGEEALLLRDYTEGIDKTLQCSFEQELQSSSNFVSVNELFSL